MKMRKKEMISAGTSTSISSTGLTSSPSVRKSNIWPIHAKPSINFMEVRL